MGLRLVLAPNEDGLGSSAWAVRTAKALAEVGGETIQKIYVLVASGRLAAFHAGQYAGLPAEIVCLEGIRHPVRLVKRQGGVDLRATIESCLLKYPTSRDEYRRALATAGLLEGAHLVVDFAAPQIPRAARRIALRTRGGPRKPFCVTVSDHAWSRTLARMAQAADLLDDRVRRALAAMRADEALAGRVFTLPEPVTPAEMRDYWRRTLHVPVEPLAGVFGGPEVARRWAGGEPRAAIRRMLGINDELPVLHLTGGGTTVWDNLLDGLLEDYEARPPRYHVVVFSPAARERHGVRLAWSGGVETGRHPRSPRVIYLGDVAGETHHVLFSAFDLVCTRAGGGTVADALAFDVPLLLVEERGHVQVEAIRERCTALGLARSVTLEQFRRLGRAVLEDERGGLRIAPREAVGIGRYAEEHLAHRLLELARRR